MLKIGIFADKPYACTGFARVCDALARELAKKHVVYYFGRFGHEELSRPLPDGFMHAPKPLRAPYLYVPCIGGVWDREVVVRIIKHYKLDVVFTEDDWWSATGILKATKFWKKPFHFLTPIDSLPIHRNANKLFKECDMIYTPNSSFRILEKRGFKATYLPHGADPLKFKPTNKKFDKFTFVWVGRDGERKALGRAIMAFKKVVDANKDIAMVIHTDWNVPQAQRTKRYLNIAFPDYKQHFILSQMQNNPHSSMNSIYNLGHANIVTAKAGGCEMGILESGLAEVPSLSTNWTYMRENIIDGKTGWLVNWSSLYEEKEYRRMWANISIDKLAERMMWCVENPEAVAQAGIQARLHITERFNWKNTANILRKYIEESAKNVKEEK